MDKLEHEVARLNGQIEALRHHWALRSHTSWQRALLFNFLRGLALGFGSVVGATVLVAALVYALSWVDFIPVVGEWAREVIRVIEAGG
jgi:hypothetical protein